MICLASNSVRARALEAQLRANPEDLAEARSRLDALHASQPRQKDTTTMTKNEMKARMGLPTKADHIRMEGRSMIFPVLGRPSKTTARRTVVAEPAPADDMPSREELVAYLRARAKAGDADAAECLRAMGETVTDPKKDPDTARRLSAMLPPKRTQKPFMSGRSMVFPTAGGAR